MAPPTNLNISGFSLLAWANHRLTAQGTHQSPLLGPQHWLISLLRIHLAAHLIPVLVHTDPLFAIPEIKPRALHFLGCAMEPPSLTRSICSFPAHLILPVTSPELVCFLGI